MVFMQNFLSFRLGNTDSCRFLMMWMFSFRDRNICEYDNGDKMILRIINGENIMEFDDVYSVDLPGKDGRLTVMIKHLPISAVLQKGDLIIKTNRGDVKNIEIPAGIFIFRHDILEVICSEYM